MDKKAPTSNRGGGGIHEPPLLRPQPDTAPVGAELRSARNLERCPQRYG